VNGLIEDGTKRLDDHRWQLVWDGARPGDKRERLWLFVAKESKPKTVVVARKKPGRI